MRITIGILNVSDRASAGVYADIPDVPVPNYCANGSVLRLNWIIKLCPTSRRRSKPSCVVKLMWWAAH